MKLSRKVLVIASIVILLAGGHFFAKYLGGVKNTAWIYVIIFYWVWIVGSLAILLKKGELKEMYKRGIGWYWNLLPIPFMVFGLITVFLPNMNLISPDGFLALNIFLCFVNPWFEETYWRGLVSNVFKDDIMFSFIVSNMSFALSHPLILGVNSDALKGIPGFVGTFATGIVWWIIYNRTKTLRGNIITHTLMNLITLTAYVLANGAVV